MKQKILTVCKKDCRFDFYRGTGSGGQKKNKTSSACRCTHLSSGAVGQCEEYRQQRKNKETAFRRMAESKTFSNWLNIQVAREEGLLAEIEGEVEKTTRPNFLKIEKRGNKGWEPF